MKKQNNNSHYAFYGSLRINQYNNAYFAKGMEYLGTRTIEGFKLFSLGAYPCVIQTEDPDDKLVVDLFKLTAETESRIHRMELGAGYDYTEIQIDGKTFGIYTFPTEALPRLKDRHVPGGDWVKYLQPSNETVV